MTVGGITVDVCEGGCAGIWFDNYELSKVDESHEVAGEALLNLRRNPAVTVDHTAKRKCPKCEDQIMMRHFYSTKWEVEVDECPTCAGIWLDQGELGAIRTQFATEAERDQAAQAFFEEAFGDEMEEMRAQSEEKLAHRKKLGNMFRFICPSYYIPGKQPWGAF